MRDESIENLIRITNEILQTKYPAAEFAFLAGSIIRGEGTPFSDLDIVVIFADLPCAFREAFYFEEFPVETFVHTPETLNHFFELDRKASNPSLATMVTEGIVVPRDTDLSQKLKDLAKQVLADSPKIKKEEIDRLRYGITNLLDDIREPLSKVQLVGAAAELYAVLADFYLRTSGRWSAHGKAIPKYLQKANPEFCKKFCDAFEEVFTAGKTGKIIKLTEEVLEPFGGLFFDGFKLNAPADWRKPIE